MYLGNQPALSYTSFAKQDFTTSATTSYTLDQPVANENEIALFINFVRQEPTTAYSASGTSLTLTSATSASDDMYCVFLGKAVQTVNPPNGSVGTSQIADLAVTSGKLASGVLPSNTPNWFAYRTSNQSVANSTEVEILMDNEAFDSASAFDTATGRFTVPSGQAGKYQITGVCRQANFTASRVYVFIKINGSNANGLLGEDAGTANYGSSIATGIVNLSDGDYVSVFFSQNSGSTQAVYATASSNGHETYFCGYKLIE